MSNIILSKNQTEIVSALKSKKVTEVTENNLNLTILNSLSNIQIITGQGIKLNEQDSELLVRLTTAMILKFHRKLRIDEIPIIFNNGAIGEYGDVIGINVKTFNSWIKAYLKKERKIAQEELKNENKYKEPVLSEEEKINTRKQFYEISLFSKIEEVKNGKYSILNSSYIYDQLNKAGLIDFTYHDKKIISKYADELYENSLKTPSKDMLEKRKKSKSLKDYLSGNTHPKTLKSNRKKIALNKWVLMKISEGVDLKKLIFDKICN